jgi:hypothetical protein
MDKYKILSEYKNKIINACDFDDAISIISIASSLTTDQTEIKLLSSLVNKNRYDYKMELDKFKIYLDVLELVYYYNDAEKIMQDIENNITDQTQLNTFRKLIKDKPIRTENYKESNITNKNCPHCDKKYYGSYISPYMICGYNAKGFDWKGCGRDWCFKCGKKLCKSWNNDFLFNKQNRLHDSKCCKNYASKMDLDYQTEFCHCKSDFVNRTR